MAQIIAEVSRTFNEFLLLPNRTRTDCSAETVDLRTPLVRHTAGEAPAIELRSPFTSAIMQAVGTPELAIALARNGGLSFLHHNQPIADQAAAVRHVQQGGQHVLVGRPAVVIGQPDPVRAETERVQDAQCEAAGTAQIAPRQ